MSVRAELERAAAEAASKRIKDPDYYMAGSIPLRVIIAPLSFHRASAMKYIFRAGKKFVNGTAKDSAEAELNDLRKAKLSIELEIERMEALNA